MEFQRLFLSAAMRQGQAKSMIRKSRNRLSEKDHDSSNTWSNNRFSLKRLRFRKKYRMLKGFRGGTKRTGRPKAAGQVKIGNPFQPM